MEISIRRTYGWSKSHFGNDPVHTFEDFDFNEFSELDTVIRQLASENKIKIKTESKTERDSRSNDRYTSYYGGGIDIVTTVETISLHLATLTMLLKSLKLLVPIIEKYIEKKAGRKITIESGKNKITVENKKDLELAISKLKELKEIEKMSKGKKRKGE